MAHTLGDLIIERNKNVETLQARLEKVEGQLREAVTFIEWVKSEMELEECDESVMAYFNPYYWIDKHEWDYNLATFSAHQPQEDRHG